MQIATREKLEATGNSIRVSNFRQAVQLIRDHQRSECPVALTSLQEKQANFFAYMKSTLERSGYDVTTRCKLGTILQIELAWKSTPLLVATLEITEDVAYMKTAAGLARKDIVDKNGTLTTIQTSHKAFNDFMRVQLEALAPLVAQAEGSLQGHGSFDWFRKNIPGAEELAQGNTVVMTFTGEQFEHDINYDAAEVLREARSNSSAWNTTTPDYNFADIRPEDYDRVVEVPVSREALQFSIKNRNAIGLMASVDPGWNGVCGSPELREMLDCLEQSSSSDFASQVGDGYEEEIDLAFDCDWESVVSVKPTMRMNR